MVKWLLGLLMIGCSLIGRGQLSDTLEVVSVYSKEDSIVKIASLNASVPYYQLNNYLLQNLGVVDIGEALKHVPGANIKDYGGIGGLKTINYRSLGSSHTGIEQDGISVPDQQTGTVNLSQSSAFGISSVNMSTGQVQHNDAFASAYLKPNMISVFNTIAEPAESTTLIKTQSEWQSINALQNGILVQQKVGKNFTAGAQANYRFGSGVYDYTLMNGQTSISNERAPTNLKQGQYNGALHYENKNLRISILGSHHQTDQDLPGAVVFYNPKNKETLSQKQTQGALKFNYRAKNMALNGHVYSESGTTAYFQDYVLNSQGFIENTYQQNQQGGGLMYRYFLGSENQSIFLGSDFTRTTLIGSQYESAPVRESMNSVIGFTKWVKMVKLQANVSHQQIKDIDLEQAQTYSHFSPFLSVGIKPFLKHDFRLRAFYKNSFRMPTYNDLYYRSIGNIDLEPEKANLFNFGLTYQKTVDKTHIESSADIYHNSVENKIIAIPTKNLFNWSMQNIGKTLGKGIDVSLLVRRKMKQSTFHFSTNQSLNKSIDITEVNAFTYGHQLPYTPIYFASYHVNFQRKSLTTALNLLHSSSRYVLNENIAHNYLEGFVDIGYNIAYALKLRSGQSILVKAQANNLLNKNYQMVRSFPMPGRHYVFTLQYQLTK